MRWDPSAQHALMSQTYEYGGRRTSRAYSYFDNPDCPAYFGLHDILKQSKFGYSKATDQLTREVRHGRISRAKAISVEKRLISARPDGIREFSDWMGVSTATMNTLLLQHSSEFASRVLEGDWFKEDFRNNFSRKIFKALRNSKYLDSDFQNIGKGI